MSDYTATQNSIIIALAKKLMEFRYFAFPKDSFRELILYRYLRPVIIKLLSSGTSNRAGVPRVIAKHPQQFERNDIKRILIIKCDQIGDFILTMPAFSILRQGFPNAHISLICSPLNSDLAIQSGLFDNIACLDFFNLIEQKDGPNQIRNHLSSLDDFSFDLAVDLRVEADTRFLLDYLKTNMKAGFEHLYAFFQSTNCQSPSLDFAFPVPSISVEGSTNYARHTQYLLSSFASSLVGFFSVKSERDLSIKPFLNTPPSILLTRQGKGPIVGLNIGSSALTRNWPVDNFSILANHLIRKLDATIVLFGTVSQEYDGDSIATRIPVNNCINLIGKIQLGELAGIINQLDLYIGHDTGGTHLASSINQNTICLHSGVTPLETYGPVGERTIVIKCVDLACSPCGIRDLHHCNNDHRCMKLIDPLRVFDEAEKLLNANETKGLMDIERYAFAG